MSPTTRGCCTLGVSPPHVPVTRAGHREFSLGVLTVRMNPKSGCWRRGRRVAMTAVPVSCFFFFPVVDTTRRGGFWIRPILFLDRGTALAEPPTNPPGAERRGDAGGHASLPDAPAWVASHTRLPSAQFRVHDQGAVIDLYNRLCLVPEKGYRSSGSILSAGAGHSVPVCCDLANLFF